MADIYLKKHLVIVDSPSECGKTSLCLHLATKYRFNYYHIKRWNYPVQDYEKDLLDFAFDNINKWESNFVIERLHVTEEVYAALGNRKSPYDNWNVFNQSLITKANELGIKYTLITCLPPKESLDFDPESNGEVLYNLFTAMYNENKELMYNYDFTVDPDYTQIDEYLENL